MIFVITLSSILILLLISTLYLSVRKSPTENQTEIKAKKFSKESLELMKLEFEYAKESSINAQEDRLTLVNFYLGLVAAVSTLALGLDKFIDKDIREYVPMAFLGLGFISFIFILLMVRLRQSWIESVRTMNRIKEYFFEREPGLKQYIVWTIETIPIPHKFKTLNYLSAVLVAFLGASSVLIGLILLDISPLGSFIITVLTFVFFVGTYHLMLRNGW